MERCAKLLTKIVDINIDGLDGRVVLNIWWYEFLIKF